MLVASSHDIFVAKGGKSATFAHACTITKHESCTARYFVPPFFIWLRTFALSSMGIARRIFAIHRRFGTTCWCYDISHILDIILWLELFSNWKIHQMTLRPIHDSFKLKITEHAIMNDIGRDCQIVSYIWRLNGTQRSILHNRVWMRFAEFQLSRFVGFVGNILCGVILCICICVLGSAAEAPGRRYATAFYPNRIFRCGTERQKYR